MYSLSAKSKLASSALNASSASSSGSVRSVSDPPPSVPSLSDWSLSLDDCDWELALRDRGAMMKRVGGRGSSDKTVSQKVLKQDLSLDRQVVFKVGFDQKIAAENLGELNGMKEKENRGGDHCHF